jgi:Viral (Superfamily 1) RNA helicase
VKKSPSAAAVGSKKAADLVKKSRLSGGSVKKFTGSVKKSLSSSATAKIASAPVPVNVVSPLDSKSSQKKKIGIPFVKSRGNKKPKKYNFYNQSTIQPYPEVQIQDPFSFQLGFSMTVHKAQGRTIDKVVLDLHYKTNHLKRLGFDVIFVALSRVRSRSSICLIKHTHTSFEEAYGYISRLKPASNVMAFYRGFTGNPFEGQVWDIQLALGSLN